MKASITTTVYFSTNGTPIVRLNINVSQHFLIIINFTQFDLYLKIFPYAQLPSPICSYQKLDYTIIIGDENGTNITTLGPFHHLGSGQVRQDIASGLAMDEGYSVWVIVDTFTHTITSHRHIFGEDLLNFVQ